MALMYLLCTSGSKQGSKGGKRVHALVAADVLHEQALLPQTLVGRHLADDRGHLEAVLVVQPLDNKTKYWDFEKAEILH